MDDQDPPSTSERSLRDVKVAKACPESWDKMEGDGRLRFCGVCEKHVHNVEAYSEKEFGALLAASPSLPCVRIPVGREQSNLAQDRRRLRVVQTAAVAMISATLACNELQSIGENALNAATGKGSSVGDKRHVMGEMKALPPRPPPPVLTAGDAGGTNPADAGLPRDAGADAKPPRTGKLPPAPSVHKMGKMVDLNPGWTKE